MSLILKHSDVLTRDNVNALLDASGGPHVSIYLPTHREWSAVDEDPIRLKNLIREARLRLIETGMRGPAATEFLQEAMQLVERDNFWQYQSDGLVLFITARSFRFFRLPLVVDELVIVGDRFYLKPLFELFVDDGCFYVLSLSEKEVALHQCTKHSIREIDLLDTSVSLAESMRFDESERHLSVRTGSAKAASGSGDGGTVYHGQGETGSESLKKVKLEQFVLELERAVGKALNQETGPLVLAGSASLRAMYAKANAYHNLLTVGIDHNPGELTCDELQRRAFEIVAPIFVESRMQAAQAFGQHVGAGSRHVASDIESVLSAAYQHRVSKLFLPKGRYVWGQFDEARGAVQVHPEMRKGDRELLDLAAAYTLLGRGEVYSVPEGEMPADAGVAAVLRY